MNKSNVMLHRAEKLMRFRAAEYYAGLVARGIIGTPIGQAPEWMAVWRENNLDGPARRMEAAPKLIWC